MIGGPVGISLALAGYSAALLVARTFVSLIAHCTQSCPAIRVEGFYFHHFYYGLIIVLVSFGVLSFARDARTRWDSALVLGIGTGLMVDETGLVLMRVGYWSPGSIGPILATAGIFLFVAVYCYRAQGFQDFRLLDKSDVLTIISILLGLAGFLYFARPVRMVVTAASFVSWGSAVILLGVYGRRHLLKILRGQPLSHRLK